MNFNFDDITINFINNMKLGDSGWIHPINIMLVNNKFYINKNASYDLTPKLPNIVLTIKTPQGFLCDIGAAKKLNFKWQNYDKLPSKVTDPVSLTEVETEFIEIVDMNCTECKIWGQNTQNPGEAMITITPKISPTQILFNELNIK